MRLVFALGLFAVSRRWARMAGPLAMAFGSHPCRNEWPEGGHVGVRTHAGTLARSSEPARAPASAAARALLSVAPGGWQRAVSPRTPRRDAGAKCATRCTDPRGIDFSPHERPLGRPAMDQVTFGRGPACVRRVGSARVASSVTAAHSGPKTLSTASHASRSRPGLSTPIVSTVARSASQ